MRSKTRASILNYLVMGLCALFIFTATAGSFGKEQELNNADFLSLVLTILFFGTSFLNAIQFRKFVKHFYYKMDLPKSTDRLLMITRIAHFFIGGFALIAIPFSFSLFGDLDRLTNIEMGVKIATISFFIFILLVFVSTAILQIKMIRRSRKYFWEVEAAF